MTENAKAPSVIRNAITATKAQLSLIIKVLSQEFTFVRDISILKNIKTTDKYAKNTDNKPNFMYLSFIYQEKIYKNINNKTIIISYG